MGVIDATLELTCIYAGEGAMNCDPSANQLTPRVPLKAKDGVLETAALMTRYISPRFPAILIGVTGDDKHGNKKTDWNVKGTVVAA